MTDLTNLREKSDQLIEQSRSVRKLIMANQKELWGFLPTYQEPRYLNAAEDSVLDAEGFELLANTLTGLWMDSENPTKHHGLLFCGNDEILSEIRKLNEIKQSVISITDSLKGELFVNRQLAEHPNLSKTYLDALAVARSEFMAKGRDHQFHMMLQRLGLPSMNFQKVRKIIRVLEPEVLKLSYLWSKAHYRKRQVTAAALKALSEYHKLNGNDLRSEEIQEGLGLNQDTKLYKVAFTRPTLRINYKFLPAGEEKAQWSNFLATGITVVAQSDLPRISWKPMPSEDDVLAAQDSWFKKSGLVKVTLASNMELYRHG